MHGFGEGVLLLADQFGAFDPVLDGLLEPALGRLTVQLGSVPGLADEERRAVYAAAADTLRNAVRRKATRVLVLDVNAARITGRLTGTTPQARWADWVASAIRPGFWDLLDGQYPGLAARLRTVIDNQCAAAVSFARRFGADRHALPALLPGTGPGLPKLVDVAFGTGDSHRGGRSVAIVRCDTGRVVYKPRPVTVDAALAEFVAEMLPDEPPEARIRVPEVISRCEYGWASFVPHRYCTGDAELRTFYRGLGRWLAVMRLLGGSDLHAENLIAAGPVPVVVDCETLFTPQPEPPASGYGQAVDRAAYLISSSVARTGLLPSRGGALGWRGVDVSAAGALPGQQPAAPQPVLIDAGTDQVRIGLERMPIPQAGNHPTPDPVLRRYWDLILDAFVEVTAALRSADEAGTLTAALARFADCQIRLVLRDTEIYSELARMLWHPASLHDPTRARERAADLLLRQAKNMPEAPDDPVIIRSEIDDLLSGDVPMFTTTPGSGWGAVPDLIEAALSRWREADPALEQQVIRSTLVSAYLNEGWDWDGQRLAPRRPSTLSRDGLDRRRRGLAADVIRMLADTAVHADDQTVTWIAPVLTPAGWLVQPLNADCYGGLAGLAVLFAGYLGEVSAGRADAVDAVPGLLAEVLRTLRAADDQAAIDRTRERLRPEKPGGYAGLGSRIWCWLLLRRLNAVDSGEAIRRARALAEQVPAGVAEDTTYDVLSGMAGAIVPLLALSERDGDPRWPAVARDISVRLVAAARRSGGLASWPNAMFPSGLGGFAHGATGIGWALARLGASAVGTTAADHDAARATADHDAAGRLAEAAFGYEESLYAPELGGWLDLREQDEDWAAATWCHGAGGIGVVATDLLRRTGEARWADVLRRAAAGCWADGMSWNHTLCHGDLGNWEVIRAAIDLGLAPDGVDRALLDSYVLASVAEFGPISGLARDAFSPGLMAGVGGVAYQLLRMHPDCPLPSVMLPDPGTDGA